VKKLAPNNNGPLPPFNKIYKNLKSIIKKAVHPIGHKNAMTEDDLRSALIESEKSGNVESNARTMVEGVFYLGDRPVGAFMTHRSEIQWFNIDDLPDDICAKALQYRDQRCFPVADGSADAIIGAVYLDDILIERITGTGKSLREIMKKVQFVPETMPALKAFEAFKRAQANHIFVMDEYGGFAGILSIRNLIEEIVGDLVEHPEETDSIVLQDNGTWLADGGVNIDDAAEQLSLPDLAEDHPGYHTLAGLVLSLAGELPRTGDSFAYRGFCFTVTEMDGNRIDKIEIKLEEG